MSQVDTRYRFEDFWAHPLAEAQDVVAHVPSIGSAGPTDAQVGIAHPEARDFDGSRRPPQPVSLDPLASKPWVTSVVAASRITASVSLPQIRSLFITYWWGDEPDESTIASLPNLEQLVIPEALPEQVLRFERLRDLVLGTWRTYVVPPEHRGWPIPSPEVVATFQRVTDGPQVLGRLPSLQRLRVSREVRERVDPIAELPALRWLSLYGWANQRALGRAVALERLSLAGASMSNLRGWRSLAGLRELRLDGRVGSLEGLERLASLERLSLGVTPDPDLSPVAQLEQLRELSIGADDAPPNLVVLGRLHGLRRFSITLGDIGQNGRLPTIGFLAGLQELEEVELRVVRLEDGRLDPLFELPRLRRLVLTGAAGPNINELRRRRPEVEVEVHLTGEPPGRVVVGPTWYQPPSEGLPGWSIFQDLHAVLGTETNDGAERRIRAEMRRRDPQLLARLRFDSESGAVGLYAESESEIRAVAEAIRDLAGRRSP